MPQTKRRAAWGSNEPAGNGRRRIRYWADKQDGKGYRRVSETIVGSRRDAERVLALRRIEHDADSPTPTVGQAYELWWEPWARRRVEAGKTKARSLANYRLAWEKRVRPRWGDVSVSDVRPPDLQRWFLGLTYSQAALCKVVLSKVLDLARFEGATDNDPFSASIEMPPRALTARSTDSLELEELPGVWDAVRGTEVEAPFLLCAYGSCRVGESLAVRPDEVEEVECAGVGAAVARVARQARNGRGDVSAEHDMKTRDSERWVVVPGAPGRRLLELAGEASARGDEWLVESGGLTIGTARASRVWKSALADAGLRFVTMSTLRPTWQTIAKYKLGIEPNVIERLMGHTSPGVTGQHYDRPHKDDYVTAVCEAYARNPYAEA